MPVKRGTEENMLKNLLMGDTGDPSYFKNLKDFLQEQDAKENAVPQICTAEMMKKITEVLEEEISKTRFVEVGVIISAIQYTARSSNHSTGLKVLLSNDLINVLANVFEETQKHVSDADGERENASVDLLMETLLETINDVADSSRNAKKETVGLFTEKLMTLIVDLDKKFHVRVEAVRTLNLLLEECLDEIIEVVRNHPPTHKLMCSVAKLLTTAGDFEMQVACTEALARLVKRSDKSNYKLINGWFSDADFASSFMNIRDETFETDCRKFLNHVNEHHGTERSVYSFPCISAYLGSQKLKQPVDANLEEFWVDFNKVSHRITLYVAEEEQRENSEGGMWETVTIQKEAVKKFYVAEMGERQTLFMTLNVPASELLPSCSSDSQHAHIAFSTTLDVCSAAVAVFGEEKARRPKHKHSISQVHVKVHGDDSSECASPGPLKYIRSADESSDSISVQNAKIHGRGGADASGNDTSGTRVPKAPNTNVTSGISTRSKVSVPCNPMITPSHYSTTDVSSVCGSVRSVSTSESNHSTAFSGISVKPIPRKTGDFAQPKTPLRTSSSAKRVKTPLQITGADSGNESAASSHPIGKKASISSGLSISSCGTPSKLQQKLQQAGIIQHGMHEAFETDDGKTNAGHRSDTAVVNQKRRRSTASKVQNAHLDTDDSIKSDPTHGSRKSNERYAQRQLRPRVPPKATRVTLPNEDLREASASQSEDKKTSSGEKKNSKTKSSRKFRLYSERDSMMTEKGESGKEPLDKDAVVPSSIPTEEGTADVIPDSMPPSGQPQAGKKTNSLTIPPSNQSDFEVHPRYPVAHSPSLSTLTEESTQSSRSKGKKIATPQSTGSELEHFKSGTGHNKIAPTPLQEQIIEEDLQETTALAEHSHGKSSHASRGKDESFGDEKRQGKRKSKGRSISSGDADDEDDYMNLGNSKAPKISPNCKKIREPSATSEAEVIMIVDVTTYDPGNVTSPKSLPPSRAFRKMRLLSPESSQELSQLEFTSQMGSNPKKGKQRKNPAKVVKDKNPPAARKEKVAIDSDDEIRPRVKSKRAAARAATKEILSLSQQESPSSGANKTLTLHFQPSSSDEKTPARPKSAKKASKSPSLSQGPFDFSVYEYDSDVEKSESITFRKISPLKPRELKKKENKQGRKRKICPKAPATKSPEFAVFDLVDTDSCKEISLKEQTGKKKPKKLAKPVSKVPAKTKSPPPKKSRRKRLLQNTSPRPNQDKPSTSKKQPKTKSRKTPASLELSDIEQPRDAQRMSTQNLLDQDEEFCDENICDFMESFTNRQRQFFGNHFSGAETAEALRKLLNESKNKQSTPKSNNATTPRTNTEPSAKEHHRTGQQTPKSTTRRQITTPRDTASTSKTNFGSQIFEEESEDVVVISMSSDEGLEGDTVSVDNFSKICQSMIHKSGHGLATKRSRRNLPKINYLCRNSDSEPSVDDLQEDTRTEVSSPEITNKRTNKRKTDSDAVSELSWLTEKPKKKLTTYSKVHCKKWSVHTSLQHREVATTVKKKKETSKRHQPSPPAIPTKKVKKNPSKIDYASDDIEPRLLYYREIEAFPGRQLIHEDTDEVFLGRALTSLGKKTREKTANKSLPPFATLRHPSPTPSIEVLRDEHDQPDDVTISPLTPLIMDELVRDSCLADLVTPKALISGSSTKKTPKQVTFNPNPSPVRDESMQIDITLKSGPSSSVRPTSSALKRKYGELFSEDYNDGEDNEEETQDYDPELPAIVTSAASRSAQGAFRPKKLFKGAALSSDLEEEEEEDDKEEDEEEEEVASQRSVSDDGASSESSNTNPSHETVPTMHITKMLKAVGETLKKKMQTKRAQTKQLTEGAVKTTQRQFSKLLNKQFQARYKAQEEFKSNLLGEIVGLETDLSQLQDMQTKMQRVLEQHQRKTASTLNHHVHQVKSLHVNMANDAEELNDQLGRHLLHCVKQILSQEMTAMQKKIRQDAQQHELQQMKKGLQTMFTL